MTGKRKAAEPVDNERGGKRPNAGRKKNKHGFGGAMFAVTHPSYSI